MTLNGLKGLVVGVANEASIAWGCAQSLSQHGATIGMTYLNDKTRSYTESLATSIQADFLEPLDVTKPEQQQNLFDIIHKRWGRLDFLVHSIAFAPKEDLHGRVVDSSVEGFLQAMNISCHSLLRLAQAAEPFMEHGGSIVTMSYVGSQRVVPGYGLMGPVKAALEACVRSLAVELAPSNIRVNAISPGPIMTRAGSGLPNFVALVEQSRLQAPLKKALTINHVGELCAFLVGQASEAMTGQILYVDGGLSISASI